MGESETTTANVDGAATAGGDDVIKKEDENTKDSTVDQAEGEKENESKTEVTPGELAEKESKEEPSKEEEASKAKEEKSPPENEAEAAPQDRPEKGEKTSETEENGKEGSDVKEGQDTAEKDREGVGNKEEMDTKEEANEASKDATKEESKEEEMVEKEEDGKADVKAEEKQEKEDNDVEMEDSDKKDTDGKQEKMEVEEKTEEKQEKKEEEEAADDTAPSQKRRKKSRTGVESLMMDTVQHPSSTKRERKSVTGYIPENFTAEMHKGEKPIGGTGRGSALADIPSVRNSIESAVQSDPILSAAHKLLFGGGRGRGAGVPKKLIKGNLLRFNGYLPPIDDDEKEEQIAEKDEKEELKMASRAYKMTMPLLKSLCDFFDVDRRPEAGKQNLDKEALVDRLLDFLGAPDVKQTKSHSRRRSSSSGATGSKRRRSSSTTPKKSSAPAKRSRKSDEDDEDDDDDDDEEEEEEENGEGEDHEKDSKPKMPSDGALRKWVRAYVTCFNLDKATTKHAIETASDKFGVDLTEKKARIKEMLTDEMT